MSKVTTKDRVRELLDIEEREQIFYMTSRERRVFQEEVMDALDKAEYIKSQLGKAEKDGE